VLVEPLVQVAQGLEIATDFSHGAFLSELSFCWSAPAPLWVNPLW